MSPSHFSPPLFLPVYFSVFLRALRVSVVSSFPLFLFVNVLALLRGLRVSVVKFLSPLPPCFRGEFLFVPNEGRP